MKINKFYLLLVVLCLTTFTSSFRTRTSLQLRAEFAARMEIELKFRNNDKTNTKTLQNPLRLFKLSNEHKIVARLKFMWVQDNDPNPNSELATFNYKILDITKTDIVVYKADQNSVEFDESKMNSSSYLMTIKVSNIDLPCNGYLYICTYKEMLREYKKKLRGVKFKLPPIVEKQVTSKVAGDLCMLVTIGPFTDISKVGFICADSKEDAVFYQSFISEKILENARQVYQGALQMVNEVSSLNTIKCSFIINLYDVLFCYLN